MPNGASPFLLMDIKKLEEDILNADPETVKSTLEAVREARENKINDHCATADMVHRKMGSIPTDVYYFFLNKYGKETVNSKKFWKEFFNTYTAFRTANKI